MLRLIYTSVRGGIQSGLLFQEYRGLGVCPYVRLLLHSQLSLLLYAFNAWLMGNGSLNNYLVGSAFRVSYGSYSADFH
jgi:hypothetical protein